MILRILIILVILLALLLLLAAQFLFLYSLKRDFRLPALFHRQAAPADPGFDALIPTQEETDFFDSHITDWQYTSPDGLRLHAYYLEAAHSDKAVILCHGYNSNPRDLIKYILRLHREGYSVLAPDARAHGRSEGKFRGMGWPERLDIVQWIQLLILRTGPASIALMGVSMGAATVMMTAGEPLPKQVKAVIEDCGYTSAWEEFKAQLKDQFHLPPFPLLYLSSLLCRIQAGYRFGEASALKQVKKCRIPMLFIHGEADTFVPYRFLRRLYSAASCPREMYSVPEARHALAMPQNPEGYWNTVFDFLERNLNIS